MSNSSIWPINRTLSVATTIGQSGSGSNGNEEVLHIPQSSRTGASLSDCLVSYPGHLLAGGILPFCRDAVGVFYSPSRLGYSCVSIYIYIYIYHNAVPFAWVSLNLLCHSSLLSITSGRSSRLHPVSAQSCHRWIIAGLPTLAHPCESV